MSDTVAAKSFDQYIPPRTTGLGVYDSVVTGAATNTNLWTNLGNPGGKCAVEFANHDATNSIYFRIKETGAAGTTATNGYKLLPGESVSFWMNPKKDLIVDHLAAAGTPTLKWRVSGPIYDRYDQ